MQQTLLCRTLLLAAAPSVVDDDGGAGGGGLCHSECFDFAGIAQLSEPSSSSNSHFTTLFIMPLLLVLQNTPATEMHHHRNPENLLPVNYGFRSITNPGPATRIGGTIIYF